MLDTKKRNKWCSKETYFISFKFIRCLICSWNDILIGMFGNLVTPIPKGNKLGSTHDINLRFLYSLIILVW
jgi:hypothetical protein